MTTPPQGNLATSIYIKADPDLRVPEDEECYYVMTRSGLFFGRNTPLLRSLVPARHWPRQLADQESRLDLNHPKVPAGMLADIFGFFWAVASGSGAEAVVLLAWDAGAEAVVLLAWDAGGQCIRPIVPTQIGTIGWGWDRRPYPIGLHYAIPPLHERGYKLLGDIHSHGSEAAYASAIDVADELHTPGLHVVAGRVHQDPPQLHVEYVVDGTRFKLDAADVLELDGYPGRSSSCDPSWIERHRTESAAAYHRRQQSGHTPTAAPRERSRP